MYSTANSKCTDALQRLMWMLDKERKERKERKALAVGTSRLECPPAYLFGLLAKWKKPFDTYIQPILGKFTEIRCQTSSCKIIPMRDFKYALDSRVRNQINSICAHHGHRAIATDALWLFFCLPNSNSCSFAPRRGVSSCSSLLSLANDAIIIDRLFHQLVARSLARIIMHQGLGVFIIRTSSQYEMCAILLVLGRRLWHRCRRCRRCQQCNGIPKAVKEPLSRIRLAREALRSPICVSIGGACIREVSAIYYTTLCASKRDDSGTTRRDGVESVREQ